MKFVYLFSAASGNLGDDLITIAWIDRIISRNNQVHIFVDCVNPDSFTELLVRTGRSSRVSVVGYIWRLIAEFASPWWDQHCRLNQILNAYERPDLIRLGSILRDCHYMHFLGGGYANAIWPQNLHAITIAAFFKKRFSFSLYWTGASVHPVPVVHLFDVASAINSFDRITTRDEQSRAALSDWSSRVECTCDDLFMLHERLKILTSSKRYLFLNHQSDLRDIGFFIDKIKSLVFVAGDDRFVPVYLEGFLDSDRRAGELIKLYCPRCVIIGHDELAASLLVGGFDVGCGSHAIVSRFHLHMILAQAGVTGQFISPDTDYYKNKHDLLRGHGSPFTRFDTSIQDGVSCGFDVKALCELKVSEADLILDSLGHAK